MTKTESEISKFTTDAAALLNCTPTAECVLNAITDVQADSLADIEAANKQCAIFRQERDSARAEWATAVSWLGAAQKEAKRYRETLEQAKRDFETLTESVDIEADIPGRISAITKALADPPANQTIITRLLVPNMPTIGENTQGRTPTPEEMLRGASDLEAIATGLRDVVAGRVTPIEEIDPSLAKAPCKTCGGTKVKRVPRDRQFPEHWMEIPCPGCRPAKEPVQPAPAEPEKEEAYLIYFDDRDVPPEIFSGREDAEARFERLQQSWTCHLFRKVECGD